MQCITLPKEVEWFDQRFGERVQHTISILTPGNTRLKETGSVKIIPDVTASKRFEFWRASNRTDLDPCVAPSSVS